MKKVLFYIFVSLLLLSCEKNSVIENDKYEDMIVRTSKLTLNQAKLYASMFAEGLDRKDPKMATKSVPNNRIISNVDYFIEEGDTLLYAINYENEAGYILIGGDNSSFPILAHANQGSIIFNNLPEDSPVMLFINAYKARVKNNLQNPSSIDTEYYDNWKDLGKAGYEYEIIFSNNEPTSIAKGRLESSGKAEIYPYTGIDLDYWSQEGGYNVCAPGNALIGCPAIALGMLLYDTSNRVTGNSTITNPNFEYYPDAADIRAMTDTTVTAIKLKQIADKIPDYSWGIQRSGASTENVVRGLKRLGYVNAQWEYYDFETLYENMTFEGYNFFGEETLFERGVLVGANFNSNVSGGHVWFCDGYYEAYYTMAKKFLGIVLKKWTEYDDRLYMNWGAGPNGGNGWYKDVGDNWVSRDDINTYPLQRDMVILTNLDTYVLPEN